MGKKNKGKPKAKPKAPVLKEEDNQEPSVAKEEDRDQSSSAVATAKRAPAEDDSSSSSSSDEDDDEHGLVLEGVLVRNPDVSDSEDSTSSEEEDDDEDGKPTAASDERPKKKQKTAEKKKKKGQKTKESATAKAPANRPKKKGGPEILQADFIFCDMNKKYFDGLGTLLASSSPIYALLANDLADVMIDNVSVGTVLSIDYDQEGTVYGLASVINVTMYQDRPCVQALKKKCLDHCPEDRKAELGVVLSGKTKRPAGFFLHARVVNLPLEVAEILQQQLVLDMDWAVENAEEEIRKSLDFGAFVRLAPTFRIGGGGGTGFKYFDDEIFAENSEFSYDIALPKPHGAEEVPYVTVIVMTKTGHRAAMKDIHRLVQGG